MERGLVLRQHFFGSDSEEVWSACKIVGEMCNLLAMTYLQQEDFGMVLELLKKAEILTERDDAGRAVTYNNLACYYRRRGKLHSALQYLHKALKIEAKMGSRVEHPADTHLNTCAVLSQIGRHQGALEHAQSALILLQEELFGGGAAIAGVGVGDQPPRADRIAVLAIAYHNMGVEQEFLKKFEHSLQSYRKGVEVAQKYLGGNHAVTVTLRNSTMAARRAISARDSKLREELTRRSNRRPRGGGGERVGRPREPKSNVGTGVLSHALSTASTQQTQQHERPFESLHESPHEGEGEHDDAGEGGNEKIEEDENAETDRVAKELMDNTALEPSPPPAAAVAESEGGREAIDEDQLPGSSGGEQGNDKLLDGSAAALRPSTGEARLTHQTATSRRGARGNGDGGAAAGRLSATGVATEDNQQGAVGSLLETQQKPVSNNDMKPFVAVPRRDPRVWFDAIKDGALPRPEALVELSKAGEAELAELALPTRKQEPYRYTDLESLYRTDFTSAGALSSKAGDAAAATAAAVAPYLLEASRGQQMVFVNGVFSEQLSDVSALGGVEGLVAGHVGAMEGASLDQAKELLTYLPEKDADFRTTQGSLPFASLNQACFADAGVIMVADGVTVEKPIQVIFCSEGGEEPTVSHPRLVVKAGADSHLTLTQSYLSQGGVCLANGFTRVQVGDRATVTHDYAEEMSASDRLVDTVSVDQTTNSTYSVNQILSGAFDSRSNFQIDLLETGSHCNVFTAALTTKNQRQDVHSTIRHKARGTSCTQEQRNVVADTADCVFKGRIVIDQIAQKTDADQLCRTLLVSDKARVTVMPSMEIIANDVKCTHGATICDLEDEELFYLMSRGISKIEAKTLVIKSFADIVIKRFADPNIRPRLAEKLLAAAPRADRATKGTYQSI
eukprot:g9965.t1